MEAINFKSLLLGRNLHLHLYMIRVDHYVEYARLGLYLWTWFRGFWFLQLSTGDKVLDSNIGIFSIHLTNGCEYGWNIDVMPRSLWKCSNMVSKFTQGLLLTYKSKYIEKCEIHIRFTIEVQKTKYEIKMIFCDISTFGVH